MEIILAKGLDVVAILGGFHTMTSYMGSVGTLMKGSGLEEALRTVYGKDTVEHIFSGKAVSKALRAHFLTEAVLKTKLLEEVMPDDSFLSSSTEELNCEIEEVLAGDENIIEDELLDNEIEDRCNDADDLIEESGEADKETEEEEGVIKSPFLVDINELNRLRDSILKHPENSVTEVSESEKLKKIGDTLQEIEDKLSNVSRTARLWLQHMRYIEILKLFVRAERTGNWSLYLTAISKMINIFAATGHIHYAKCARLHLQNMLELETTYPWLYALFSEQGYHTVRRSDKYWAGLWTDLIIEQCLMRSLKSRGGISRGRGITESVRQIWVHSMHRSAGVHNAMCNLTGNAHRTSEQHIELGKSRIKRDYSDFQKLKSWFDNRTPFDYNEPLLKSLSSGLTSVEGDKVNCDDAENVGYNLQETLDKKSVEESTLKRNQIFTLDSLRPGIVIEGKTEYIDPLVLYTRLIAIMQREKDIEKYFFHDLTPEPTTLFKDGMLRKTNKAVLRDILVEKQTNAEISNRTVNSCVIDGGALLYKVTWNDGTYRDIIKKYVNYVKRKYATFKNVCVVFDGYEELSTKSLEQLRRSAASSNIEVSEDFKVTCGSKMFLKNYGNKRQLIKLLSKSLRNAGCEVIECSGEADVHVVRRALELADNGVVVVADDTDILVLLVAHWKPNMEEMYFRTVIKTKQKLLKTWKIETIASAVDNRDYLLFAHAWGGCDTTSATYRKGKRAILQHLKAETIKKNV